MTEKKNKKLTLTKLINEKEKYTLKEGVVNELYLEQLDATITVEQPDRETVMDAIESEDDNYLVYSMVLEPNLKDKELQDAYDCDEPTDIVSKIFDPGTIRSIAKHGLKLAGFESNVKVVEKLKN